MAYFSKFLRGSPSAPKVAADHAAEFHKAWTSVKSTLLEPDERQLARGITSTNIPAQLQLMVDALVRESTKSDDSTGACLDYLLTNDVLNTLVRLSEADRPYGVQAEVLRTISNLVLLLDEHFLVHASVHKAVIRLLRACAGDELPEAQRNTSGKPMGAALASSRVSIAEYEEDLVNLLCILCSRIRAFPDLLLIFFHDKNWYTVNNTIPEEDETDNDSDEAEEPEDTNSFSELHPEGDSHQNVPKEDRPTESDSSQDAGDDTDRSATPTRQTVLLAQASGTPRTPSPPPQVPFPVPEPASQKPQYEFLIFNYLMRYIHREGTVGDFGRAGLLFLMDVAMAPADIASQLHAKEDDPVTDAALALADYILDGDFTDVLAAGLGAVYSLLPYKLVVKRRIEEESDGISNNGAGMILGMAPVGTVDEERRKRDDEEQRIMTLGVEVSSNPDFKARLDHFLNLIEFAEDVLRRTVFDGVDNVGEGVAASTVTTINLGRAIAQAVVDKIRSIFLQNVLYPSILECSEADGSAVAVFSYIDSLLRTMVNGGKLSEAFIDFLIADDDGLGLRSSVGVGRRPQRSSHADRDTKRNRRRSSAMVLLELEAPQSMGHSDYFSSLGRFTLKDLLLTNLKGQSKQAKSVIPGPDAAGVAALRLLYLLLSDHCSKTVDGLLSVVRDPTATNFPRPPKISTPQWSTSGTILEEDDDEFIYPGASPPRLRRADPLFLQPSTTAATREEELLLYKDLIARIDPKRHDDVLGPGYDHYLKDAVEIIQGQSCYHEGLQEWVSGGLETITSPPMTKQHRLLPTDPLLNSLLSALRNYFSYSPEYNVALTGVIASICACPHRSMAGWLTLASANDSSHEGDAWIKSKAVDGASPTPYNHASDSDGDDASIDAPEHNPQPPDSRLRDPKFQPVLYTILSGLVAQLDRYRMIVDDFDTLLDDRRHGLMFVENLNDALTLTIQANEFIQTGNSTSLSVPKPSGSTTPNPSPKPKAKSNLSFVPSFLAPKKSKSGTSDGASVSQGGNKGGLLASPFTSHYQRTTLVEVEPFVAPAPSVGAWSESSKRGIRGTESLGLGGVSMGMSGLGGFDSDDVFASSTGQHRQQEEEEEEATVTISLSRLLDNVVILEESIKELVAIAQVRCSLGIDSVRYV